MGWLCCISGSPSVGVEKALNEKQADEDELGDMAGALRPSKISQTRPTIHVPGAADSVSRNQRLKKRSSFFTRSSFNFFSRRKTDTVPQMRRRTFLMMNEKRSEIRKQRNMKDGLSDELSRELIKLFEKLDRNGDGALQKNEAKAYLTTIDNAFGKLSKSDQHRQLQEFISSFPGAENGEITLGIWKAKAKETFGVNEAGMDEEEWAEMQEEALLYTRKLLKTFGTIHDS